MAWKITDYNLQSMKRKNAKAINKEFSRLKKTVTDRVSVFTKHGYGNNRLVKDIQMVLNNENSSRRAKEHAIIYMKRFLNMSVSSKSGYEKRLQKTIEFWTDEGVEGLDMDNIEMFVDFLEWSRSFYDYKYNAPELIETWNSKVKTGDLQGLIDFFSSKVYGDL